MTTRCTRLQVVSPVPASGCSAVVARLLWKQDVVGSIPTSPTSNLGLMWAAGFFDGEGWIGAGVTKRSDRWIALTIRQNNREVLDRFQQEVGVGKVYGPSARSYNRLSSQPYFEYRVQKIADVREVVAILWPHLSSIKRQQALRALARYATSPYGLAAKTSDFQSEKSGSIPGTGTK